MPLGVALCLPRETRPQGVDMDPFSQMGSPPEEPRPVLPKLMLKIGFALLATATLCVLVVSIAAAFLQRWGPAVVLLLMGSFSGLFAFFIGQLPVENKRRSGATRVAARRHRR